MIEQLLVVVIFCLDHHGNQLLYQTVFISFLDPVRMLSIN